MAHGRRGWLQYSSDTFGTTFEIKADNTTAANNGQVLTPTPAINNFWPLHRRDLRYARGVDGLGFHDSCIATSTGSPIYALGATFNDSLGNTYTVFGLHGEQLNLRDAK